MTNEQNANRPTTDTKKMTGTDPRPISPTDFCFHEIDERQKQYLYIHPMGDKIIIVLSVISFDCYH